MKYMLIFALLLSIGTGLSAAQETPAASGTPPAESTLPAADASGTPIFIDPLLGLPIAPPVTVDLPDNWLQTFDTLVYTEIDGSVESVPFALYTGPVTGGIGTIVLVWGYDSVTTGIQFDPNFGVVNPWLDGLRILRTVIFDPRCNIGTAPRRDYTVGGLPASGTTFNVVDCPLNQPDTRGWFAALNIETVNFAFFVYIDPLPPAGSLSENELQSLLDSFEFHVAELIISPEELEATRQALQLTPEATAEATQDQ